jgi:hypothetical protein
MFDHEMLVVEAPVATRSDLRMGREEGMQIDMVPGAAADKGSQAPMMVIFFGPPSVDSFVSRRSSALGVRKHARLLTQCIP